MDGNDVADAGPVRPKRFVSTTCRCELGFRLKPESPRNLWWHLILGLCLMRLRSEVLRGVSVI